MRNKLTGGYTTCAACRVKSRERAALDAAEVAAACEAAVSATMTMPVTVTP